NIIPRYATLGAGEALTVSLCCEWLLQHRLLPSQSNHPTDFTKRRICHVKDISYSCRQNQGPHPPSLQRKNSQIPNAPPDVNVSNSGKRGATDISEGASR